MHGDGDNCGACAVGTAVEDIGHIYRGISTFNIVWRRRPFAKVRVW